MENEIPTSNTTGQRTLAAVVFTDGVNFSTRMALNEDRTLQLLRHDLELMRELCRCFSGRVLKSTGDGLLMCFISAVKAVECAVEIQRSLITTAQELPPGDALQHRIGIHLGDVFISDTDVMGNGVNIAARLQAESEPSGICISQTVYDVVRNSLRLETTYLGPRELKNIPGEVPAYRIRLPFLPQVTDPYDEITRNLSSHANLLRIKKLIFYICRNQWESEQFRLEELNLKELIQELHQVAPTQERLRNLLRDAVKNLSKQTEYLRIADTIAAEFSRFYYSQVDATQIVAASPDSTAEVTVNFEDQTEAVEPDPLPDPILQVAQMLDSHRNAVRIKKLLFYAYHRRWENDPKILQQTDLATLVQDLQAQNSTLEALRSTLEERVKTLSKRTEYTQIAEVIVHGFSRLYADQISDSPLIAPVETSPTVASAEPIPARDEQSEYDRLAQDCAQHPNAARLKKLMFSTAQNRWENDTNQVEAIDLPNLLQLLHQQNPTLEQLQTSLDSIVKTLNKQAEYTPLADFILEKLGNLYPTEFESCPAASETPVEPELTPSAITPPQFTPELVDLRLQIMKYANPLRAKILLFSTLHHAFSFAQSDWLALKQYELETLLQNLLTVCKTINELEARLLNAARNFMEPEENTQTIAAIVRSVRPFYTHEPISETKQSLADYLAEETQIAGQPTQSISSFSSEDEEHTCQLFSSVGRTAIVGGRAIEATQTEQAPTQIVNQESISQSNQASET
jgi:adenylate cyclase